MLAPWISISWLALLPDENGSFELVISTYISPSMTMYGTPPATGWSFSSSCMSCAYRRGKRSERALLPGLGLCTSGINARDSAAGMTTREFPTEQACSAFKRFGTFSIDLDLNDRLLSYPLS